MEASVQQHAKVILNLARSADFCPHSRWIATRTGIPLDAVNVALHHLLSHGELRMESSNSWKTKPSSHA